MVRHGAQHVAVDEQHARKGRLAQARGPLRNRILAGNGNDTVRLRGDGPNIVLGGAGDDIVEAYAKGHAAIDCGPGFDRVNIGFNRLVKTRNCELVNKLYKKR